MISKIDNKYNKKKAYTSTKQVNVSLIYPTFVLTGFFKTSRLFDDNFFANFACCSF